MLDINFIRENPETVRATMHIRQLDAAPVERVLALDERRRAIIQQV